MVRKWWLSGLLLVLFCASLQAQNFDNEVLKKSGDPITITIQSDIDLSPGLIVVYRKTGITATFSKVAEIPLVVGKLTYEWQTVMPASRTVQYRFVAILALVVGAGIKYGPATSEGLVTRK